MGFSDFRLPNGKQAIQAVGSRGRQSFVFLLSAFRKQRADGGENGPFAPSWEV